MSDQNPKPDPVQLEIPAGLQIDNRPTVIDGEAFSRAPKFYGQVVITQVSPNDVTLQFCITQGATDGEGKPINVLIPQAVVYFTTGGFRTFLQAAGGQMAQLDESMGKLLEASGLKITEEGKQALLSMVANAKAAPNG